MEFKKFLQKTKRTFISSLETLELKSIVSVVSIVFTSSIVFIFYILTPQTCYTSDSNHAIKLKKGEWRFSGIFGSFDYASISRGFDHYVNICSHCHSMDRLAYRNLLEIGFPESYVKDIAQGYTVVDGIDENGDNLERTAVLTDHFVAPFHNVELAKMANNGVAPPDLSLIIKARPDGVNYVYSLLTGYTSFEPDKEHLYQNPFFPAGRLAMAPPLTQSILSDGETIESAAKDVVNFLHWASEPEMEDRKRLGMKTLLFLFFTLFVTYKSYVLIWKDIKHPKKSRK